jgi:riboflavin biosynthesis pyrimidine reductase
LAASSAAKNAAAQSSSAWRVTVTFTGDGGRPRATRAARRSDERTSNRGSSLRIVIAPTRIASLAARSASTRSKSASFDSRSRVAVPVVRERLGAVATVVDAGRPPTMRRVCEDLGDRGVRRLMVEGGGSVHTQMLTDDLADELQLVVAPFFVGDSAACRFVGDGRYPWHPGRRATLAEVRQIGDVVLLRYALSPRFEEGT